jgi:polyisoprenoid-binding protein YceI
MIVAEAVASSFPGAAVCRMGPMRALTFGILLLALCVPARATAETVWRIDRDASSIRFDYALAGVAQEGRFLRFGGEGMFYQANPGGTRFDLEIETSSLDLGNDLISAFALSADWFDAAHYPAARYRLAQLTMAPGGEATALGDLTLKGKLQVVTVPLKVEIGGDTARARGSVAFDPKDFGIGFGPSAMFVSIGDGVTVSFDLTARRVPDSVGTIPERSTP